MADADAAACFDVGPDSRERVYGKYHGTVTNIFDPMNQGRRWPSFPKYWARSRRAGQLRARLMPECNRASSQYRRRRGRLDRVRGGDVSRPIWVGAYWAVGETPTEPLGAPPTQPTTKIWRSELGLTASLNDMAQTITIIGRDRHQSDRHRRQDRHGDYHRPGADRSRLALVQEGSAAAFHPAVFGDQLLQYLSSSSRCSTPTSIPRNWPPASSP